VVGYLRLLLNEELGPLTQLQRKCLESIDRSTQRLRSVVDTLLDVSSLETERMHFYDREYDFRELAVRAVREMKSRFEDQGIVLTDGVVITGDASRTESGITCAALPGRGDADKLRRAMVHVLDNAVKFTPRGGQVAVSLVEGGGPIMTKRWYAFVVADS